MSQQSSKDDIITSEIDKPPYMQNRELSWLDFNKRVLDQGADPTVPLLERLNFISIFWSNLQEFFMVRVGSLTDLALVKKSIIDAKSGMTPAEQLAAIYARCHELYPYYEQTYENLRALLAEQGIHSLRKDDLTESQRDFLHDYMDSNVLPFLSPQIVNARHPFPHLENGGLYIVVRLDDQSKGKGKKSKEEKAREKAESKAVKNQGAEGVTLGIIPLPRQTNRIIELPGGGLQFILVERAIELFAAEIFSMYSVKHTNVICVTRNADLDATEGAEEQGEDYREHMKRILKKRSRLAPVRLESERPLSRTVKSMLMEKLELSEHQLFVTTVPLNMSYTWDLGSRLAPRKRAELTQEPFTPHWPACLSRDRSIIEQVSEHEILLSYPYQSMDAFVQLLREAAVDPSVISIKITLYRLASQSHLAEALIAAAENGKEVTALFELRARFDESNNIEWSQRFEQAGCHVIYGFRNYKVHSKICTITRQTEEGLQHITQLGTGNYNEKTAKLYTDFSFITSDPAIGRDAADFFRNMALENTSDNYDVLWVAPLMIKQNILRGIEEQINRARRGLPAGLFFKTNSITDKEVIEKIVEASQAGVETHLFVRSISCILPGVEGYTDNVREVSIVGQLLEHSRIYGFGTREDCKVYLSSADLMTRNMDKRIEIAWPILDEHLREQVLGYLDISYSDTAKLRELLSDGSYTPLWYFAEADDNGEVQLFDSQKYLISEAQRSHLMASEIEAREDAMHDDGRHLVFPVFGSSGGREASAASLQLKADKAQQAADEAQKAADAARGAAEAKLASEQDELSGGNYAASVLAEGIVPVDQLNSSHVTEKQTEKTVAKPLSAADRQEALRLEKARETALAAIEAEKAAETQREIQAAKEAKARRMAAALRQAEERQAASGHAGASDGVLRVAEIRAAAKAQLAAEEAREAESHRAHAASQASKTLADAAKSKASSATAAASSEDAVARKLAEAQRIADAHRATKANSTAPSPTKAAGPTVATETTTAAAASAASILGAAMASANAKADPTSAASILGAAKISATAKTESPKPVGAVRAVPGQTVPVSAAGAVPASRQTPSARPTQTPVSANQTAEDYKVPAPPAAYLAQNPPLAPRALAPTPKEQGVNGFFHNLFGK